MKKIKFSFVYPTKPCIGQLVRNIGAGSRIARVVAVDLKNKKVALQGDENKGRKIKGRVVWYNFFVFGEYRLRAYTKKDKIRDSELAARISLLIAKLAALDPLEYHYPPHIRVATGKERVWPGSWSTSWYRPVKRN